MRSPILFSVAALALAVSITGCESKSTTLGGPVAIVKELEKKPIQNLSRPTKKELDGRLEKADTVFHAGCRDEEKAACKYNDRVCSKPVEKALARAVKKGPVVIEWEEPRVTWETNYGVSNQYWFVNGDGSGDHYYLIPSPDDVQTICGETYCGWHKKSFEAGALLADARFTLTAFGATEPMSDLDHCPPSPEQPAYHGGNTITFE